MGLLKVISNLTARPGTIPSTSAFFFTLGSTAWSNFSTVSRVQKSSGIDEPFCLKYRRPCSSFAPSSKTTTLWISNTSLGPILSPSPLAFLIQLRYLVVFPLSVRNNGNISRSQEGLQREFDRVQVHKVRRAPQCLVGLVQQVCCGILLHQS